MRSFWLALCLAGCGDKAVDLQLKMPPAALASQFAPGCVTGIDIWLNGNDYPIDEEDSVRDCIDIPATNGSWDDVHAAIRGKFSGDFPDSGLGGVEVFGFAGDCAATEYGDYDLIFFANAEYDGGDTLDIPVVPNTSCTKEEVRVRPIDILKLVKTNQCAQSGWTLGKMAVTTLVPLLEGSTDWWGGQAGANVGTDGVAVFQGSTKIGPDSCLAIGNYTGDWDGMSCIGPAEQRACATGTEVEAAMINKQVALASQDLRKVTDWGSLVIGAVWNGMPLAGATVTIEPADYGEVVYFDAPAGVENGTGSLTARGGTATGPSGLFGIYTETIVTVKITANGRTVSRKIGGFESDRALALLFRM